MKKIVPLGIITIISLLLYNSLSAQNAGIGTTDPRGKLSIGHSSSSASPTLLLFDSASISRVHFQNAGTLKYWEIKANSDNLSNANSRLSFSNSAVGFSTMTFDGLGQIGIGTDLPFERLDIHANLNLGGGALLKFNYSPGSSGDVLTSNGTSTPTWQQLPATTPNPAVGFRANFATNTSMPNYTFTNLGSYIEAFDDGGNNFNPSNGIFTAPSAGMYQLNMCLNWEIPLTGESKVVAAFLVNGTSVFYTTNTYTQGDPGLGTGQGANSVSHTFNVKLNYLDQVSIAVNVLNSSPRVLDGNSSGNPSVFSGFKVY
jgi:hypothetical protein